MLRDLRHAIRTLRSWRFGALAAVATLAIGIGTTTGLFAFMRAGFASSMGTIDEVENVGRLYSSSRSLGIERSQLTVGDLDVLSRATSFDAIGAYTGDDATVTIGSQSVTAGVARVSSGFFRATRARAVSGRLLAPGEFSGRGESVVVTEGFWREHFGGSAPGSATLTLDGARLTVVGVLPADFGFSFIGIGGEVWMPVAPGPDAAREHVNILARLKSGTTWAAARAELEALGRVQNPNGLWTWTAITVQEDTNRRTKFGYAFMFGPAFVILLIGCVNVACMLLARGIERDVELSVRSALGANRWRILRQLLVENVLLAVAGGALGCALAFWILRSLANAIASFQPAFAARIADDVTLLPIAFGFSAAATLVFGTLPAIRLSRRDVTASLKGGTVPATARFVGYGARDLVVFVELGAAVVLVVLIGMWLRFFAEMQRVAPLFAADRIVAVEAAGSDAARAAERIAALPGVSAVSVATRVPGGRGGRAAGQARTANRTSRAIVTGIDTSFFDTMGLPILRGRAFDRSEAPGQSPVAILSEGAAAALFGATDPLGAVVTIARQTGSTTVTIVGVCRDAMSFGAIQSSGLQPPDIYVPRPREAKDDVVIVARAAGDPQSLVRPVGAAARPAPAARLPRAYVVGDNTAVVPPQAPLFVRVFVGFAIVALLLAATGIFGVVSQSVAQRTTEFGVRMAVGASRAQVLRMVLVREGKLIAAAIAAGAIGTVGVGQRMFGELITIAGTDPRMWATVMALCAGFAGTAALLATYRILKMDPWRVLRGS
jgi:putative ABC transport system permease protein